MLFVSLLVLMLVNKDYDYHNRRCNPSCISSGLREQLLTALSNACDPLQCH